MKNSSKIVRLGDRLLENELISENQLKLALREQKRVKEPLGRILINLGFITEKALAKELAAQMDIPFISLKKAEFDKNLVKSIPPEMARQHLFVPIKSEQDNSITVAMVNPANVISVDAIQEYLGTHINIVAVVESEISSAISSMMETDQDESTDSLSGPDGSDDATGVSQSLDSGSLVEEVDGIIEYAFRNQATDVHIEPEKNLLRVRYRIDGILHSGETFPLEMASPVTTRIKILGGLNITERRLPQDGRITMDFSNRKIDLRVSSMPTAHGENIVIRILDRGSVSLNLKDLGVSPNMRVDLAEMSSRPYGMLLVSGPTGSGKTTTLYSLLLTLDSMSKKIVTVEDPIEYELPLIRQSQVDSKINYTFASGLRTILRQDPDVILVGEVRDRETADVAMRASLTGHVVFSSIHTNTSLGVVARLLDIGIDPFLITSSLSGALAQRLARRVCNDCRDPYTPTEEEAEWLGIEDPNVVLYKATGCSTCRQTGFAGRTAIFELFKLDNEFASIISKGGGEKELEKLGREKGMTFMIEDGKRRVIEGTTTIQEVLRVCQAY